MSLSCLLALHFISSPSLPLMFSPLLSSPPLSSPPLLSSPASLLFSGRCPPPPLWLRGSFRAAHWRGKGTAGPLTAGAQYSTPAHHTAHFSQTRRHTPHIHQVQIHTTLLYSIQQNKLPQYLTIHLISSKYTSPYPKYKHQTVQQIKQLNTSPYASAIAISHNGLQYKHILTYYM